jgi:PBP1b-binding outer membrane lipoprotein LpoB
MRKIRVASLVLALILVFALFSACSNGETPPTTSAQPAPATSNAPENSGDSSGDENTLSYPIPGEKNHV